MYAFINIAEQLTFASSQPKKKYNIALIVVAHKTMYFAYKNLLSNN